MSLTGVINDCLSFDYHPSDSTSKVFLKLRSLSSSFKISSNVGNYPPSIASF